MFKRVASLLIVAGVVTGIWQGRTIYDWWILRGYQPPAAIAALADNTTMTTLGRRYYYLARPSLDDKPNFANHCQVTEKALVLGCYSRGHIYLLQVQQAELVKVMEVTAAHETLHAAYSRLSTKERTQVNDWLSDYFSKTTDPGLQELIAHYDQSEPGERLNELHSILGTQESNLGPELEAYYRRYFSNRQAIVAGYRSYEAVFANIENQQQTLKQQLEQLKVQIDSMETRLNKEEAELDATNQQLRAYQAAGNTTAYNSLVPTQNAQVRQYNTDVEVYKQLITAYNQKVQQYNSLSVKQNDLVESLDSSKYRSQ